MRFLLVFKAFLVLSISSGIIASEPKRRTKPPEWPQEVIDVFFDNAHDQLVGERPQKTSIKLAEQNKKIESNNPKSTRAWSELIDADTLTSEVRRLNISLTASLSKPGKFKGGGNLLCRRDFAMLAVLFKGISEFEGEIRWKAIAPALANECLAASDSCEKGTDESLAVALKVKDYLDQLIQGQKPELDTSASPDILADFVLLMQRMELAVNEGMSPKLASKREFRRSKQAIAQEAQILALLAIVIEHEDYGYGQDEEYLEFSRQLRESSQLLRRAADDGDYERAREAAGNISQSCSQCHEGFRG